jgi:hypothetical protein
MGVQRFEAEDLNASAAWSFAVQGFRCFAVQGFRGFRRFRRSGAAVQMFRRYS